MTTLPNGAELTMHFGTFPILTGTPEELRKHASDVKGLQIIDLQPGSVWS